MSDYEPLDADACKHRLAIVKSLECCRPVLFRDRECFIHVIHTRLSGGRIEMDVWLTGSPERIAPELITFPKKD